MEDYVYDTPLARRLADRTTRVSACLGAARFSGGDGGAVVNAAWVVVARWDDSIIEALRSMKTR